LCTDGEVKVPNSVRERWSIFDDRFDGQDNVSDEERYKLSVPYCKEQMKNWYKIDTLCQMIAAREEHNRAQYPISIYEAICRFMNPVSDDFWVCLSMDEAYPEGAKLSAYRAICNVVDRSRIAGCVIGSIRITFVKSSSYTEQMKLISFTLPLMDRHKRAELINYDEGVITAGGPSYDRYIYGSTHVLFEMDTRSRPFAPRLPEHLLYALPLTTDLNCRRKRLELYKFLRADFGARREGYDESIKALNELMDIPLDKNTKSLKSEQDKTLIARYKAIYNPRDLLVVAGMGLVVSAKCRDCDSTYFPEHRELFKDTRFTSHFLYPPEHYGYVLRKESFKAVIHEIINTFGFPTLVFMCKVCMLYNTLSPSNTRVNKFLQIAKNLCSINDI
jgi:hypothetical protein